MGWHGNGKDDQGLVAAGKGDDDDDDDGAGDDDDDACEGRFGLDWRWVDTVMGKADKKMEMGPRP